MKLSIIIVHFKAKKELFACVGSIISSHPKTSYEIIVVDNDEEKTIRSELLKKFPKIKYVASPRNGGFGAGSNLGAKQAKGEYLFFLNPDTVVQKNAIDDLVEFAESKKNIGTVAPLLLDSHSHPYQFQGTQKLTPLKAVIVQSFVNKLFPNNPVSKKFWMHDWDKKGVVEVDVIPGAAFLVPKKVFEKIDGFDEKFFLYFEELDLSKRIQELGLKLFIIPKARVIHHWGKSTDESSLDTTKIMAESRFYYFKKHYGLISALFVKAITSIGKTSILITLIFLLGVFLRFYRIPQNFVFGGENGYDLLRIKDSITQGVLPLIGSPTSHPWLYFGPLFFWIFSPILIISKFNPVSSAYFGAVIASLVILLNYFVIKKIFNLRSAIISSLILAISPLFLVFSREARFFSLVIPLDYIFILLLYQVGQGKRWYLFWLFFVYGIMVNIHYSSLVLFPVIIAFLIIAKISPKLRDVVNSFIGFLIPSLPFLIYDGQHGFSMVKNLTLWIPYRVLGFFGFYHKNTVSAQLVHENAYSIFNYWNDSFVTAGHDVVGMLLIAVTTVFVLYKIYIFIRAKKISLSWWLLLLWFFIGLGALFIHGNPPIHYFVPILPLPILLFSLLLSSIWQMRSGKFIVIAVLLALSIINFTYYFSSRWFYMPQAKVTLNPYRVPYAVQQDIAHVIVQDAHQHSFELQRVGPFDTYEDDFAQNYIYLLWLNGNEPVDKSSLHYTIVENPRQMKFSAGKIIYNQHRMIIQKYVKK